MTIVLVKRVEYFTEEFIQYSAVQNSLGKCSAVENRRIELYWEQYNALWV
jgi:hypothetical protein